MMRQNNAIAVGAYLVGLILSNSKLQKRDLDFSRVVVFLHIFSIIMWNWIMYKIKFDPYLDKKVWEVLKVRCAVVFLLLDNKIWFLNFVKKLVYKVFIFKVKCAHFLLARHYFKTLKRPLKILHQNTEQPTRHYCLVMQRYVC